MSIQPIPMAEKFIILQNGTNFDIEIPNAHRYAFIHYQFQRTNQILFQNSIDNSTYSKQFIKINIPNLDELQRQLNYIVLHLFCYKDRNSAAPKHFTILANVLFGPTF